MKRYSMQREMILDALTHLDHPTAPEIYEKIRTTYPQISLGTVYRNLNMLTEAGEIVRLSFPSASDRFDCNTSDHTHVLCSQCGRVIDVSPELPRELLSELDAFVADSTGVTVNEREMVFYGICSDCKREMEMKESSRTADHSG